MFRLGLATLALAAVVMPVSAQQDEASAMLSRFMAAWSAGDAKAISELFAPDADFVSPNGIKATGRAHIEAFYAAAFAHGYAGSHGVGEVVAIREIAPGLVLIDGRWSIEGAKTADGAPRPAERGILVALLRRDGAVWHIVALREGNGAAGFTDFPPA